MIKRMLAFVIVLAMLICALPVNVIHAEQEADGHTHSEAHACGPQCAGGTVTWIPWGDTAVQKESLPTQSGHYYLTADVQLPAQKDIPAGADITICLNGWNIKAKSTARVSYVLGKLTVSDCTAYTDAEGKYIAGSVIGGTTTDGAVFNVRRGGVFVLENGIITGGNTTAGGGALYTQKGTTAGAGGKIYMYGGEISGNQAANGGAVVAGGADSGAVPAAFYMYGGTITGNTANNGGGVYVVNNSVAEICGGTVTGNTATGNAASKAVYMAGAGSKITVSGNVKLDGVLFANASNTGLKVNGLADGTQITLTTQNTADIAKNISLAPNGSQMGWNAHWVTANGQSVSLVNNAFIFGHYHGTQDYTAWDGGTGKNTLPSPAGYYYLVNDIQRGTSAGAITIGADKTQHLCLNGYQIVQRNPAGRLYNIQGSFFVEDCSAYTDSSGNYCSGGITYAGAKASTQTNGIISVQRGSVMTITGGQIYGFSSQAAANGYGAVLYVQGANDTGKAVLNLQGGQIHSNTALCNGAAVSVAEGSNTANPSEFHMTGGEIYGNTSTGTGTHGGNGGGVYAKNARITLGGGKIYANKATQQGGGVYFGSNNVKATVTGDITISGNSVNGSNSNLYLGQTVVLTVKDLTGSYIGVDALNIGRAISDTQQRDVSQFFVSDSTENKISFKNNCVYLGTSHEHGADGGAGDTAWSAWTSKNSLPTTAGSYFLKEDVQLAGTVTVSKAVNLCLNGKTITAAENKQAIVVENGGVLSITDCQQEPGRITGGTGTYGGAINVRRGGVLNLYNGKITENTATEDGGGVYTQAAKDGAPGGIFHMYGGEISHNTALKQGGGVCVAGGSEIGGQSFTLQGGTITHNSAQTGGGIYGYPNTQITLAGGTVKNNTAQKEGGGLYIHKDVAKLEVRGTPVAEGNLAGQQSSNIHLAGSQTIQVGNLESGAKLFVTADKAARPITTQATAQQVACFHSDSAYRMVAERDGKAYLDVSSDHVHCDCFHKFQGCSHVEQKWEAWDSGTSLPENPGHYYLTCDVQLSKQWRIAADPATFSLCLNGYTVTAAKDSRVATVQAAGILNITDCTGSGKLTGGNSTYGGCINVNRRGLFNLYGGSITGNRAPTKEGLGGAVYVGAANAENQGGVFRMYGGAIMGNTAYRGGAVAAGMNGDPKQTPASICIYGGKIVNNRADNHGGSIYAGEYSEVKISGGTIASNAANISGGGVYTDNFTKLTVSGGVIESNTSGNSGGGVYCLDDTVLQMDGGKIAKNESGNYGGGIYMRKSAAAFTGGEILNNTGTQGGSGLFAAVESRVQLGGNVNISYNQTQAGNGGAVSFSGKSEATVSGGTFRGNRSVRGGAIIVQSGSKLTVSGGSFMENTTPNYGAGIYVGAPTKDGLRSSLLVSGGNFTGNRSDKMGGAIYCTQADLQITGGTFSKNAAGSAGGAVYGSRSSLTVSGGTFSANTSDNAAAGIYCNQGSFRMTGGLIRNNKAKNFGCGVYVRETDAKILGGTITGNVSGKDGAGIYAYDGDVQIGGSVQITDNTSTNGAGGAVGFTKDCNGQITGGVFSGNKAINAGAVIIQNNARLTVTGGTFEKNTAERYGGAMYVRSSSATMKNALFRDNEALIGSGGIHCWDGKLHMEQVTLSGNCGGDAGGALAATRYSELTMKDCVLEKNTAVSGGALLMQNWAEASLTDVTVQNNEASEGAGIYVFSNTTVTVQGGQITQNTAKTRQDKNNKTVGGIGAGIFMHTGVATLTGRSTLHLKGVQVLGNQAEVDGAGVYVDKQMVCYMDGCTVQDNTAGRFGAGVYQGGGSKLFATDTKILANTGKDTGSGIYASSDLVLDGCVITGNKTEQGAAVYVAPARYDGHSYVNAVIKLGGDLQICDNEGTQDDLYFDAGVAAVGTPEGFGTNTKVCIQLHSGVLTNSLLAAYNYEGGDQHYVVTYGDRSLTEPEYVPTADAGEPDMDPVIRQAVYAAGGVLILAATAAAVLLILGKKKKKAAREAAKD